MEHRTTQGGTTTLLLDDREQAALRQLAKTYGTTEEHLLDTITRLRQANPLDDFAALVNRLPSVLPASAAPKQKRAGVAAIEAPGDPLKQLEGVIQARLASCRHPSGQATSQMQQTEAILLQALTTCLQTQALVEMLGRLEPRDG